MTANPDQVKPTALRQIAVEWTETSNVMATIDTALAREIFGLGGTPDDQIEHRVTALLAWNPQPFLERLAAFTDVTGPNGYKVTALNGVPRADW